MKTQTYFKTCIHSQQRLRRVKDIREWQIIHLRKGNRNRNIKDPLIEKICEENEKKMADDRCEDQAHVLEFHVLLDVVVKSEEGF